MINGTVDHETSSMEIGWTLLFFDWAIEALKSMLLRYCEADEVDRVLGDLRRLAVAGIKAAAQSGGGGLDVVLPPVPRIPAEIIERIGADRREPE